MTLIPNFKSTCCTILLNEVRDRWYGHCHLTIISKSLRHIFLRYLTRVNVKFSNLDRFKVLFLLPMLIITWYSIPAQYIIKEILNSEENAYKCELLIGKGKYFFPFWNGFFPISIFHVYTYILRRLSSICQICYPCPKNQIIQKFIFQFIWIIFIKKDLL